MQKKNIKAVFFGVIVFFSLLSCIDNQYDLGKDIDLTMLVGGEKLTLPIGSSEKMYLNKFVKVEDTELLDTLKTGEYYLVKEDAMEDTKVKVEDVKIDNPAFDIKDFDITLPGKFSYPYTTIPPVKVEIDGSFEFQNNNMPKEVVQIHSFEIRKDGEQQPYIEIAFSANLQSDDKIDLTDLQITFPDFFIFEKGQKGLDNETNIYKIGNSGDEKVYLKSYSRYVEQLKLERFEFQDEEQREVKESTFHIEGNVALGGKVTASLGEVSIYGSNSLALKTDVILKPDPFFIASVVGKVDPEINIEAVKVKLTGIPDFLNDDDVKMDLTNPAIRFHVENPFGLPILLNLDMQGWKNGKKTHNESVKIQNIKIPANPNPDQPPTPATIILSRLGVSENADILPNAIHYKVSELGNVFLVIPDEMELNIEAKADTSEDHIIFLGETEQAVKINYEVNLPLSFGENMSIVYKDTINGWNEDIKDLEDIERINLETQILNTIPLELSLSGYAIDVNGKKLERITVGIKDNATIPPCNIDDSESTASIVIEIEEHVTASFNTPAMKNMDGIVLNVTAKSTEIINNKPLKSTQYIMLKNMKAKIPGGVKLNMNK
jgi:hypothetical protein